MICFFAFFFLKKFIFHRNLCDLTIYLMNHPIKEVREKALKITSNIKPNASLSDFLLESFSLYLTKVNWNPLFLFYKLTDFV